MPSYLYQLAKSGVLRRAMAQAKRTEDHEPYATPLCSSKQCCGSLPFVPKFYGRRRPIFCDECGHALFYQPNEALGRVK